MFIIIFLSGTTLSGAQQTIRVATPNPTILKATGAGQNIAGGAKQIITVHKAGSGISGAGQPQIVTLVKTTHGMQVATVSIYLTDPISFKLICLLKQIVLGP